MGKYSTKQAAGAQRIETLGGGYALKWDCEVADVRYLFKARRTKGVRGEFLSLLAEPGAWRGSSDGWQCAERDVLPPCRGRGDCENVFDEMKNQWGRGGFTAHSLAQTALFAGLSVIAANLRNVFTRLGGDGSHREAATSRPPLIGRQATLPLR